MTDYGQRTTDKAQQLFTPALNNPTPNKKHQTRND
jgi:hypothetical protein